MLPVVSYRIQGVIQKKYIHNMIKYSTGMNIETLKNGLYPHGY